MGGGGRGGGVNLKKGGLCLMGSIQGRSERIHRPLNQ